MVRPIAWNLAWWHPLTLLSVSTANFRNFKHPRWRKAAILKNRKIGNSKMVWPIDIHALLPILPNKVANIIRTILESVFLSCKRHRFTIVKCQNSICKQQKLAVTFMTGSVCELTLHPGSAYTRLNRHHCTKCDWSTSFNFSVLRCRHLAAQ